MNWELVLDSFLINLTDEFSGFQYYNICNKAALINSETGKRLASSKNFKFSPEEFEKIKDVFINLHSKIPDYDSEISLGKDKYQVVNFDHEKNDMYLKKHLGGGVVSCADYSEAFGVIIVALFNEQLPIQDIDGTPDHQNLGLTIKAVDHTKKYIEEYGKRIDLKN